MLDEKPSTIKPSPSEPSAAIAAQLATLDYPFRAPCQRCGGLVGRAKLAKGATTIAYVRCVTCNRGYGAASRCKLSSLGVELPPFTGPSSHERRQQRLAREAERAASRSAKRHGAKGTAGEQATTTAAAAADQLANRLPIVDRKAWPDPSPVRYQLDFDEVLAVMIGARISEVRYNTTMIVHFQAIGGTNDGGEYPYFVTLDAGAWRSGGAAEELEALGIRSFADMRRPPIPPRSVFFAIRLKASRSSSLIYASHVRRLTEARVAGGGQQ